MPLNKFAISVQSAVALIAGLFITFSQSHDANIAITGLVIIALGWCAASIIFILANSNPFLNGFILLASGAMIYQAISFEPNNATTLAWILLQAWGFFGAIAEIIFALRAGKKSAARRDHLISALLAAGLFVSQISITEAADSVSHVGFFGAYAIFLGVHLGISAATPSAANLSSPKA